ncbi:hypothetical protein FA10DRAFT_264148 [Acaromyces ingoldii]|uniref:NADH dehydrogenase [ubiquinone] 1 alpha subcomplex subunit n=1 Tax=Acaromyces ingoldii TaxID=215250 RepID=A0A316YVB7_9BASI|nr:hypothetical protein FA10DRAFT_264148 [Acaromyces ingoldii]PWN93510.1 hypothetical protein FA10DRAFT_264148 [Acaromyces ingoldii]
MTSLFRRLSTVLGLGKGRYFIGRDLDHNRYYEFPSLDGNKDPRRTRRLIEYAQHKELGEHDQSRLPAQWLMWLRHTRRSAPSIVELEEDQRRIETTRHNARILEQKRLEELALLEQKKEQEQEQEQRLALGEGTKATEHLQYQRGPGGVPTATVTDSGVQRQTEERVGWEREIAGQGWKGSVEQERTPDMDVWEASRKRVQEQQAARGKDNLDEQSEAQSRRAARRAEMQVQEAERQRARQYMSRSPLDAFDVSFEEDTPTRSNQGPAELKSRFGRATGPGEEWSPQASIPTPKRR